MMVGLQGTGKSHLGRQIAEALGAAVVQTDRVRKELFPNPSYAPWELGRVYAESYARIEVLLREGRLALFDATNLKERDRRRVYDLARKHGAALCIVATWAPEAVVRQRLRAREQRPAEGDLSDAGTFVYERAKVTAEPIAVPHIVANTTVSSRPIIELVRQRLTIPARTARGE